MADDTKNLEGQSFRNEALTGSGTIKDDGTYGDPIPDPTEMRGLSGRRTSGGRVLPDLPSAEIEGNGSPDGSADESNSSQNKNAPKRSARS